MDFIKGISLKNFIKEFHVLLTKVFILLLIYIIQ